MTQLLRASVVETPNLGAGHSARLLANHGGDLGILRPMIRPGGGQYVTLNTGKLDRKGRTIYKNFQVNAPSALSRDDWMEIDRKVRFQFKQRLQFAAAIAAANRTVIPNGFGKSAYQYWIADGKGDAQVNMDPVVTSERSKAVMDSKLIPLPVIHSDGQFTARQLAIAAGSSLPLDKTGIAMGGRAIGETLEGMYLGTSSYKFADGTIYGALNHPAILSATFTAPTAGSWTPRTTYDEILQAFEQLKNKFYYGPFALFFSNGWAPYLDTDYTATYNGGTLRLKASALPLVKSIQTIDMLSDYKIIFVDITNPAVFEQLLGMPLQTVQWSEEGGMVEKYKTMLIDVPLIRQDYNGYTGILVANATSGTTTTTSTTTTTTTTTP